MDAMDAASLENLFVLDDAMDGIPSNDALPVPLQQFIDAFPPSPPPSSLQSHLLMPSAPSPSLHLDPMQTSTSLATSTTANNNDSKKKASAVHADSPMSTAMTTAKLQKLSAAKQFLTLDDVEREILRHNAHLPPDAKRKMAKAEFKRLKHCETVRQSRVRKKVIYCCCCCAVELRCRLALLLLLPPAHLFVCLFVCFACLYRRNARTSRQ